MRLVVDASVLVAELLGATGRARLADVHLDLFIAEHALAEVHHELPRRAQRFAARHGVAVEEMSKLVRACFDAIDSNVITIPEAAYAPHEDEARWRCARDPQDWPTVAAAMAINASVWTEDGDFLGTGVATWTTVTVNAWLERQPSKPKP